MHRKLYNNILPFALMIALIFQADIASATHYMGGNITYICNGNGRYSINLSIFRDCNGSSFITSDLTVSSSQCNFSQTINMTSVGASLVAPLCPSEDDVCDPNSNNGTYGIEEWVYRGSVILPVGCGSDWIFSWDGCCRNSSITTGSSDDGIYFSALLDNTVSSQLGVCNTSPAFNAKPTLFLCANQETRYNQDVADAQNDSLVYSLVNCVTAPGSSVGYNVGLSGASPLVGTTTINSSTGEIVITPSSIQVGVVCALVEEYRNGVKIGEVVRDLQVNVVPCSGNTLPIVSGINGTADSTGSTGMTSIDVCAGTKLEFKIKAFDNQVAGNVPGHKIQKMRWNNSILNANFIIDYSTPNPTADFIWTPTANDVGQHDFLVEVTDNACPIYGTNTLTYTINVLPNGLAVAAEPNDTMIGLLVGQSTLIDLTTTTAATGITYNWSPADYLSCTDCANPTFDFTAADSTNYSQEYIVTITDGNGCMATDTVIIDLDVAISTNLVTNLSNVNVYPNPSNGNAILNYNLTAQSEVNIELYDITGRKIHQIATKSQAAGKYQYNLNEGLKGSGIYFVRMTVDGNISTQKVIVY